MAVRSRLVLLALAAAVAAITTYRLDGFWAVDACLDWGGRVLREPLRCEVPDGQLRDLGALRRQPRWWVFSALPGMVLATAVCLAGRAVVRRSARPAG